MVVYVDGKLVPKAEARISVFDHGFLYGDGVFEGIRVYGGNVFRLDEHMDRLYESAKTIDLQIPMTQEELTKDTLNTVATNGLTDAYIRLVVSRGPGDLGIDPAKCKKATVVIIVDRISLYPEEFYDKGISLITSSIRRIPSQCLDPRIKSLNYLNNIMAKIEARRAGVPEALMLNYNGHVAECTADNIFMVKNGAIKTPALMQGALGGITRRTVIELAGAMGIPAKQTVLGLHDFYNADECFLTGTGAEIVPVITIDGRKVGDGLPGEITRRFRGRYSEVRTQHGTKVQYKTEAASG